MNPTGSLLRVQQFKLNQKRQTVRELETTIEDFLHTVGDLDLQIEAEEANSGISDKDHISYSPFARATSVRRNNLLLSIKQLEVKLTEIENELDYTVIEFHKALADLGIDGEG